MMLWEHIYILYKTKKSSSTSVMAKRKVKVRRKGEGSVHIVSSAAEWRHVFPQLSHDTQSVKVVGLDCEWVSEEYSRHPVALLQLAAQSGLCVLVRLCHMDTIPTSLKLFLADNSIVKVGVSVKDDGKKLYRDYGLPVNGCVDLRFLLARIPNVFTCPSRGLQGLAKGILGVELSKHDHIRCGDWEAETLNEDQIQYAAADAVIGVDIFTTLTLTKLLGVDWQCDYPPGSEVVGEAEFWQGGQELCLGLVDQPYHLHSHTSTKPDSIKQSRTKHIEASDGGTRAYSPRQRPLHFNCQLQSPSGRLLRRCDSLRAEWYLKKNLGRKVSDNPFIVQLRYEPETTVVDEDFDDLYEKHADADGMCVVCGNTDTFIKKSIIPNEYRKYFHRVQKSARRSHNLVILCPECYQVSSQHDAILRQRLAQECDAPLDNGAGAKTVRDKDLQKVQAAAKALKLNRNKIPEKRVSELEATIADFYGITSLDEDMIEKAFSMDIKVHNSSYVPHGKLVMNIYRERNERYDFEKMWRKHFLDTMQPKFLPPFWEVDFRNIQVEERESS